MRKQHAVRKSASPHKMTMRYTHRLQRQAVETLPQFKKEVLEADSPQIPPQEEQANVVSFPRY